MGERVSDRLEKIFELVAGGWTSEDAAWEDARGRLAEWEELTHDISLSGDTRANARRADGLLDIFPEIAVAADYPCGCDALYPEPIFNIIMHLNDSHGEGGTITALKALSPWTRDDIADWVQRELDG